MSYNMPDVGPGRRMKYPYTFLGKVFHFPWKWSWKYGRGIRFTAYSAILCFPIFYKIDRAVNSPANVEQWKEIRAKRRHDPFAAPSEHGKHH